MALDELELETLRYLVANGVLCQQRRQVSLSVMAATMRRPADALRRALEGMAARGVVRFLKTPRIGEGDAWVCITPEGCQLLRAELRAARADEPPAEQAATREAGR